MGPLATIIIFGIIMLEWEIRHHLRLPAIATLTWLWNWTRGPLIALGNTVWMCVGSLIWLYQLGFYILLLPFAAPSLLLQRVLDRVAETLEYYLLKLLIWFYTIVRQQGNRGDIEIGFVGGQQNSEIHLAQDEDDEDDIAVNNEDEEEGINEEGINEEGINQEQTDHGTEDQTNYGTEDQADHGLGALGCVKKNFNQVCTRAVLLAVISLLLEAGTAYVEQMSPQIPVEGQTFYRFKFLSLLFSFTMFFISCFETHWMRQQGQRWVSSTTFLGLCFSFSQAATTGWKLYCLQSNKLYPIKFTFLPVIFASVSLLSRFAAKCHRLLSLTFPFGTYLLLSIPSASTK